MASAPTSRVFQHMGLNEKANERPVSMPCPKCGADVLTAARFCETCGAPLTPEAAPAAVNAPKDAPARCRCGAAPNEADSQGYCTACGVKRHSPVLARLALPRDHVEIVLSPTFAAVTDRGKRHANNQDDVALAREEIGGQTASIIVVCDGVSSAQEADRASAQAAAAARDALLAALRAGTSGEEAMAAAMRAAHGAALTIPYRRDHETLGPPGTTIVAAVALEGTLTVGWVGDSRAYWFAAGEARLLTRDHSWVNEMVDAGEMTEAEALRSKQAHAITRCLGPLNGEPPDDVPVPSVVTLQMPPSGLLLVCSDGLWNYAAAPDELAALIGQSPADDALALSRRLVDFAMAQGGRDNITAVVAEL